MGSPYRRVANGKFPSMSDEYATAYQVLLSCSCSGIISVSVLLPSALPLLPLLVLLVLLLLLLLPSCSGASVSICPTIRARHAGRTEEATTGRDAPGIR